MATGAGDSYWTRRALPGVLKHHLLRTYVPQFAGMTGSRSVAGEVVLLDGYAGRGRFEDGSPASAELILRMAEDQRSRAGLTWICSFVERDKQSAVALGEVVAEYRSRGVRASWHHGEALDVLGATVASARGRPLFVFLDPCGLGVPYDRLRSLLGVDRPQTWPPTELLLNFSLEAVRRIAGHLHSAQPNERSLARLDESLGGTWWRRHFSDGVTDKAVAAVAEGFASRLGRDTGLLVVSVPVRRAPHHKPIYHLIFGTRRQHGLWVFGDALARASEAWWDTLDEVEGEEDPNALITVASMIRPKLETTEARAVPAITGHLAQLLETHSSFTTVDHTMAVFGDFYGQVREPVVRKALALLRTRGGTVSDGRGKRPRDIVVVRS